MSESILLSRGGQLVKLPRREWEKHLTKLPHHVGRRLSFMSKEHHRVRYFVVKELPHFVKPLKPQYISEKLQLPLTQVQAILDDLEKHLFFLVRDQQGVVSWAYPVTVDNTPHHLTFSTGERLDAA